MIGSVRPWQVTFLAVGLPGLLVALLLYTVREPFRRGLIGTKANVPFRQSFAYIFKNKRTFLCHNAGFGLLSMSAYASSAWVPEFYRRTYHWDVRTIGLVYGTMVIIFGSL